jgi:predicted butyrate kinase (DUF1464 family)
MPRVVGIDPGTVSFDVCGLQDGETFLERSVATAEVAQLPDALLAVLKQALPLDLIAGPSGYGLPLVRIEAVGEPELRLLCLAEPGGGGPVGGLRALIRAMSEARLPVIFTPGAIQLPTVPAHRKVNRVDLGTADKVCSAAAAIADQARRHGIPYGDTSFVIAELGGAFTSVLSVDGGRIVAGQGGSSGPLGYLAGGALDAEAACLLGSVTKRTVFSGGVAFVAGDPDAAPELIAAREDAKARLAKDAFVESLTRAVAAELAAIPGPREVLLCGRLCRIPAFRDAAVAALSRLGPAVRWLADGAVKLAARGAAFIADGLAAGRYAELVGVMRLRGAEGTVLDHLYLSGADEVRRWDPDPTRC